MGGKEGTMGIAAIVVGGLIALVIAVAIIYGTVVGLSRAGRFVWRLLVPESAEASGSATPGAASEVPCWTDKECPTAMKESCPAYLQKEGLPCWLANLRAEGRLRTECLTCKRFNIADLVA